MQPSSERSTPTPDCKPRNRRLRNGVRVSVLTAWLASGVAAANWPNWRGPELRGVSRETNLPSTWSVLWSIPYGGNSSPVVCRGRVFVINKAGAGVNEQERVMALNADTGAILWERRLSVFLTDIPSARVGWTSPVVDPETGNVYAHGVQNTFICLTSDGNVIWERQLHEEFGTINGYGGRTHTPIIDEDLVIVSFLNASWGTHARGHHRYLAMNKRTGSVVWWAEPGGAPLDTTGSMPSVAVVGGARMLIGGNADGSVCAMNARTGEPLWRFALSKRGINASVVVDGDLVYACHSEDNIDEATMGRVVCIDATGRGDVTATHEKWRLSEFTAGYASPAIADGRLYAVANDSEMVCLDAKTGRKLWAHGLGTAQRGSPVVADGKVYITEWNGLLFVLDAKTGKEILKQSLVPAGEAVLKTQGSPAIADGRVYFNTGDRLYCLGEKSWTGRSGAVPPLATERDGGKSPASVRVTPADVTLNPGQSVAFQGEAFNALGQPLGPTALEWSVAGFTGEVDTAGRLTVGARVGLAQGIVTGKSGSLSQTARVRVVPTPPFTLDFEATTEGRPPEGFVAACIKFVGATRDGEKVLAKPGNNPRFVEADTFFGLSTWSNYTLEADVLGTEKKFTMPNIGLINRGYSLVLMGNHQRLRIVSWVPQPRIEKRIQFKWDPEVWYRLKFRVQVAGGVGVAQGKVWPRDKAEPAEWQIDLEDPNPNPAGGPGLHGYSYGVKDDAPGTDVFYDNVKVTWNG